MSLLLHNRKASYKDGRWTFNCVCGQKIYMLTVGRRVDVKCCSCFTWWTVAHDFKNKVVYAFEKD